MSRSFFSRPAVQRFLAAPGPLVLYSLLAGLSVWAAVSAGWSSAGAFVGGGFALFFGGIVTNEVRYLITGCWPPGP